MELFEDNEKKKEEEETAHANHFSAFLNIILFTLLIIGVLYAVSIDLSNGRRAIAVSTILFGYLCSLVSNN